MPYDHAAIRTTIEDADLALRMVPRDQLEAARVLLTLVGELLRPATFVVGPVSAIVSGESHDLVEMSVAHPVGQRVLAKDEDPGFLLVEFRHDHEGTFRWTLQWWWEGAQHADHAQPTDVALTYVPRTREFRGPDGHDAGVTLVRAIARKMVSERTPVVAEAPKR